MFLRRVTRKNKDGTEVAYLQIVRSSRVRGQAAPRTEIVLSLGREDELDRTAVRELARTLQQAAGFQVGPEDGRIVVRDVRPVGLVLAVRAARAELGLGADALAALGLDDAGADALIADVAARLVEDVAGADPLDAAGVKAFRDGLGPGARARAVPLWAAHAATVARCARAGIDAVVGPPEDVVVVVLSARHDADDARDALDGFDALAPPGPDDAFDATAHGRHGAVLRRWSFPEPGPLVPRVAALWQELSDWGLVPAVLLLGGDRLDADVLDALDARGVAWAAATSAPAVGPLAGRFRRLDRDLAVKQVRAARGGTRRLAVWDGHAGERRAQARARVVAALGRRLDAPPAPGGCDACREVGHGAQAWVGCGALGRPGIDLRRVEAAARQDGRSELLTNAAAPDPGRLVGALSRALRARAAARLDGADGPRAYAELLAVLAEAVAVFVERRTRLPASVAVRELSRVYGFRAGADGAAVDGVNEPTPTQGAILARLGLVPELTAGRGGVG